MTAEAFDRFYEASVVGYAKANVEAGYWTEVESVRRARGEFEKILPQRQATPDHWFFTLEREPDRVRVGFLWFGLRRPADHAQGFVWDLEIDPPHRRRGYGAAAMRALEPFARAHGADRISLHVFGYNREAIALYQKLGYETGSLFMLKRLGATER